MSVESEAIALLVRCARLLTWLRDGADPRSYAVQRLIDECDALIRRSANP